MSKLNIDGHILNYNLDNLKNKWNFLIQLSNNDKLAIYAEYHQQLGMSYNTLPMLLNTLSKVDLDKIEIINNFTSKFNRLYKFRKLSGNKIIKENITKSIKIKIEDEFFNPQHYQNYIIKEIVDFLKNDLIDSYVVIDRLIQKLDTVKHGKNKYLVAIINYQKITF